MNDRKANKLIRKAKTMLKRHGVSERTYDNIYPVRQNDETSIHVVRFHQKKVLNLKEEVKFLKAAKAFEEETGVKMVKIW